MGTKIQKGPLTADEVEQCKAFLGPPPVLSTAEGVRFWKGFNRIVSVLEPWDADQVKKIWPWFCALWVMNGLMRRGPVVVEHLSQQDLEPPALRAKVRKACKEALAQMKAKLVVDAPSVVPADEQESADVDSHNKSESTL